MEANLNLQVEFISFKEWYKGLDYNEQQLLYTDIDIIEDNYRNFLKKYYKKQYKWLEEIEYEKHRKSS